MMLTAKKAINVVLNATAATHLCYSAIRMYGSAIPQEILPIDTAFAGKLKYLTFWNVVSYGGLFNFILTCRSCSVGLYGCRLSGIVIINTTVRRIRKECSMCLTSYE